MAYHAFISYSHAADGQLAPALQSALHRFAKPWYQLRALRVFRDTSSLSLSPHLWPSIEKALSQSGYFLFLASPESAASPWVQREIAHWMEHADKNRLLIVLTDGTLTWNEQLNEFDWPNTSSVPELLRGRFDQEPLYLDLRWAKGVTDLSLANPRFREAVADIAATLHERPKDEMIGADVQQHRRTRSIIRLVVAGLATLTLASVTGAYFAFQQKHLADRQRDIAEDARASAEAQTKIAHARLLGAQAAQFLNQDDSLLIRSTLLAVESLMSASSNNAANTLRTALSRLAVNRARIPFERGGPTSVDSADGEYRVVLDKPFKYSPFPLRGWKADVFQEEMLLAQLQAGQCAGDQTDFDVTSEWGSRFLALTNSKNTHKGLAAHDGAITSCGFSLDQRYIITASGDISRELPPVPIPGDNTLQIWEMPPAIFDLSQEKSDREAPMATAFSPDGRFLAISIGTHPRATIRVFDLTDGRELTRFHALDNNITDLTFSPDSRYLASAPVYGDHFQVWSTDAFKEVARLKQYSSEGSVSFSPDGRWLITNYGELTHPTGTDIWDLEQQKKLTAFGTEPSERKAVAFSENERQVITLENWNKLIVWDIASQKKKHAIDLPERSNDFALDPSGGRVAIIANRKRVGLWSLTDGEDLGEIAQADGGISCVTFSPDGRFLATCDYENNTVHVWDLESRKGRHALGHDEDVHTVAFSKDGRYIATAVYTYGGRTVNAFRVANVVNIWALETGELLATLNHHGLVSDLEFSADGRYIRTQTYMSEESGIAPSYVWLWHTKDLIEAACTSLPRNMTLDEWRTYLPEAPYRRTCEGLPMHESARSALEESG